jgi:hypothetical protein
MAQVRSVSVIALLRGLLVRFGIFLLSGCSADQRVRFVHFFPRMPKTCDLVCTFTLSSVYQPHEVTPSLALLLMLGPVTFQGRLVFFNFAGFNAHFFEVGDLTRLLCTISKVLSN